MLRLQAQSLLIMTIRLAMRLPLVARKHRKTGSKILHSLRHLNGLQPTLKIMALSYQLQNEGCLVKLPQSLGIGDM